MRKFTFGVSLFLRKRQLASWLLPPSAAPPLPRTSPSYSYIREKWSSPWYITENSYIREKWSSPWYITANLSMEELRGLPPAPPVFASSTPRGGSPPPPTPAPTSHGSASPAKKRRRSFSSSSTRNSTSTSECDLLRSEYREWRQAMTSRKIMHELAVYVLDEAAMATSNDETKHWIRESMAAGRCLTSRHKAHSDWPRYMAVTEEEMHMWVLERMLAVIPQPIDDALLSSLHAYIHSCGDFDPYEAVFVTGNEKMQHLLLEESTREELHSIVHGYGIGSVFHHLFVDKDGKLKPAELKW